MSLLLLPLPASVTSQRRRQPAARCGTRVWVTTMAAAVVSLAPTMPLAAEQQPAKRTVSIISNRGGVPSVNAAESPKGRYTRQVEGQIGKLWHQHSSFRRDTGPGRLEISFCVTKKGKVESVVIQDAKRSNVTLTEISLRAVRDAKIPLTPADVYPELPEIDPEHLRFDFTFTILAQ